MTRILSGLLLVALVATAPDQAKAQLGFAAGLNFESVSDISTSGLQGTYDSATGYHAGLFLDFGVGPVGLRLGAFYRDLGEFEVSLAGLKNTVDVTSLDFPVDLRFAVIPTPFVRPYLMAGPVFSIPRSNDEDYDDSLEDVSIAGNVGFGVEISLAGMTLLPEFRYTVGVTPFVKNQFTLGGRTFVAEKNDQRSNTAMLRLGIRF
jgi:hypothetical protein